MRTTTWNTIGTDVTSASSVNEALSLSGLDFEVSKQPLYYDFNGTTKTVKTKVATIREDTGDQLGIVGKEYTVCQNREAFEFVDYVSSDLRLEKAGMTNSGLMYIISKLPDVTILGDTFSPHLIFQNGFNGGYTVKAAICPLRIVCQNQLALSFRNTPNSISLRHSASLTDKLESAKLTFLETAEYMKELNLQAEKLATKSFSYEAFEKFIEEQFPIKPDMSERQKTTMDEVRAAVKKAYWTDDNSNFTGTAWGAINAMSDYLTHKEPTRQSKHFAETQFITVTFNPLILQALYSTVA